MVGTARSSLAWRCLALSLGCLLALFFGEGLTRIFVPAVDRDQAFPPGAAAILQFSNDYRQGWELRPGVGDHNAVGFRGRLVSPAKPADVYRIAMVGDSVTYGIGVESDKTFSAVLEQLLNSRGTDRYEVLNFGVPGYGTRQVRQIVANRVLEFEPDLVVLTFTSDDVERTPVVIEIDGEMCLFQNPLEGAGAFDSELHWAIFRQSHLYRLLYKGLALVVAPSATAAGDARVSPEASWRNVEAVAGLVHSEGAGFLLVMSSPLLPILDADGNVIETPEAVTEPLARVRDLAKRNGYPVLDLEPLMMRFGGSLKLTPQDHEHFNAFGHRLVAHELLVTITAS